MNQAQPTATPSPKRRLPHPLPVKSEAEMQAFSDKFQAQVEAKLAERNKK